MSPTTPSCLREPPGTWVPITVTICNVHFGFTSAPPASWLFELHCRGGSPSCSSYSRALYKLCAFSPVPCHRCHRIKTSRFSLRCSLNGLHCCQLPAKLCLSQCLFLSFSVAFAHLLGARLSLPHSIIIIHHALYRLPPPHAETHRHHRTVQKPLGGRPYSASQIDSGPPVSPPL